MNTQTRVAIVGGGAAGLSAAYTLLKKGVKHVDVFEANEKLGGRIQSRMVRDHAIDFGGFIIYPWYKESHRLFKELGIEKELIKIPECDIFYYFNQYPNAFRGNEIPFKTTDTVTLWTKSLLKILPKTELSHPDLKRFNGNTISQYLRTTLSTKGHAGMYETFFDTVNQGYCYGPVKQSKASLMAPMSREITLHGDVRRSSFFKHGTATFLNGMHKEITNLGGAVYLNSPVTSIQGLQLTAAKKKRSYDAILFAQTVSPELYQQILPEANIECWYTHFITVAVELSETPKIEGSQTWGGIFYESHKNAPYQILSVINLEALYGKKLRSCLTVNIILGPKHAKTPSTKEIEKITRNEIAQLYPELQLKKVIDSVHWGKTMPVAQESFIEAVRAQHGQDGYYFAGDFLGAPSIETAVSSGVRAAADMIADLTK